MRKQKNIMVVQSAKLGDMVCTTPMFRAVKQKYPDAHLVVVGNTINETVLAGNPYIDSYRPSDGTFESLQSVIREESPDVVCITGPNFPALAAAVCTQTSLVVVPEIVGGWSPYVTLPYKILSRFAVRKEHRMGTYAPREYLRLLEPIDIYTDDTRKEVYVPDTAYDLPVRLLKKDSYAKTTRYIGILPGAGNEIKSWQPEKFASLMKMIAKEYADTVFVLLGAGKDVERALVIQKNITPQVHVVDCIGKLSIDELKACMSMLNMVIGADTGPQYIAEALGIPTVDIVGPCDEREQPPMGEIHKIVKVKRVKPELFVMNARTYDIVEAQRQVDDITPEMVYHEFAKLSCYINESSDSYH